MSTIIFDETLDDTWVKYDGSGCPVKPYEQVVVRFADGDENTHPHRASYWNWYHAGGDADIVAYKVEDKQPWIEINHNEDYPDLPPDTEVAVADRYGNTWIVMAGEAAWSNMLAYYVRQPSVVGSTWTRLDSAEWPIPVTSLVNVVTKTGVRCERVSAGVFSPANVYAYQMVERIEMPQPDALGWVKWSSFGFNPVRGSQLVQIIYNTGEVSNPMRADYFGWDSVESYRVVDDSNHEDAYAQRVKWVFAEYGVTPIPDDEVTDMGDYVVWNKYDPTCTVVTCDPSHIPGQFRTTRQEAAIFGSDDCNLRAHPRKPVRVEAWVKGPNDEFTRLYYRAGQRSFMHSFSRRHSICLEKRPGRVVQLTEVPRDERMGFAAVLARYMHEYGIIGTPRLIRSLQISEAPSNSKRAEVRGTVMYQEQFKCARELLAELGKMIRNAHLYDAADALHTFTELDGYFGGNKVGHWIDHWNDRCASGDELCRGDCGHIAQEDTLTEVHNGDSVCEDCLERNYIEPEDSSEYWRRSECYQHANGNYYTYEEYDEDEQDDDDYDDDNVGGRIKGYSCNVLNYHDPDRKINPSPYGDMLMGIELEVVPVRGYKRECVISTSGNLCNDYAILKHDGSLDAGGFEIVTAPRSLAEHIERFKAWKPHAKLRSWDPGCCGMHVHISSQAFTKVTLGKFVEFINAERNDGLLIEIAGRSPSNDKNAERYCQRDRVPHLGNPKSALDNKSTDRYFMVNTTTLGESEAERLGVSHADHKNIDTVELRIFRGTLNKARLLAQIEFAHAAVMFCRATSMRELDRKHFVTWLRTAAPLYPHLAKWFGVRQNSLQIAAAPAVRAQCDC